MKLLFTLLASLSISFAYSQSFSVETNDTSFTGLAIQYDFGGYIDMNNLSGEAIDLKWERIENDLPSGWETSICDPTSCKPPEADSSEFSLPVSGVANHINIHFYPNNVEGIGTTRIRLEDPNNPQTFYILSFTGDTRPLGLESETLSSLVMYPNPAQDFLYVKSSSNQSIQLELYNSTGQIIVSKVSIGNSEINLSQLPKGIYLAKVISGSDSFSQKIIHQ